MNKEDFYEVYHSTVKLQKRVINNKNFTYRLIVDLFDKYIEGGRIIDVGSGVGTIDFYLASKGFSVLGIDISKKAVEMSRYNAKTLGLSEKLSFKAADFPKGIKQRLFDYSICNSLLEHVEDDSRLLFNIHQLLKTKGIAFFSVPSYSSPLYRAGLLKNHENKQGHLRRYSKEKLIKLLENSGFKILELRKEEGILREALFVYTVGHFVIRIANILPIISDVITWLDNLVKIFGEAQFNVVAIKN